MKFIKLKLFIFLLPLLANAQMQQLDASAIANGIAKLGVNGSVLYIAAHPDDENTRLLSYLAKGLKIRTGYLSLTRGDGGQNLIGNEQSELLGLIRTQELLAARRIDGAEQFFTRANDFGFSKTADEALKIWGHEQTLADVVWIIRKFKPNVIITRFPPDARAGHGHHAASAILAREAFDAAADPKRFPEQLKDNIKPWQAKRLLWNTFNFGGNNTTAPDQLKIDVGGFDPVSGKSFGEIAAISRTNHKSQGFGSALQRGEAFEFFSNTAGEAAKTSLFDGVDLIQKDDAIVKLLADIQASYQINAPSLVLPKLVQLKKITDDKDFNHQLLEQLILACAGFWAEAVAPEKSYALGEEIEIAVNAIFRVKAKSDLNLKIGSVALQNNRLLGKNINVKANEISHPYYLQKDHPIGNYSVDKQEDRGYPENPKPFEIHQNVTINGIEIGVDIPILYKSTDPVKGERYQPVVIAPKVTATLGDKAYLFVNNASKNIAVQLKAFAMKSKGAVAPKLPEGWISKPNKIDFDLSKGDEQTVNFEISPSKTAQDGEMVMQVNINNEIADKAYQTINYEHIPNITLFPTAKAKLEKTDLKLGGKNIAYIDGAGDLVANSLVQVGYKVTHLAVNDIAFTDLAKFDAIVTGVRLYNISNEMKMMQPKLLEYVKNGGVLLNQYNVSNGLKLTDIGPYPFKLANKRVTEEDAKIDFLLPQHQVLNYPNKITQKDFDGWIQERGLYFANDIDEKYDAILSMKDTGENASNGSLLVANYGKGKFVYTSLVFFRELPAGVPGAYKLFANLLAK
jgi:LmbE family N-acetylglucosaminyl deacetylase